MFKEITENTVSKAKEEVTLAQWAIVLIAVISFLTGLVVGILCMTAADHRKKKKAASFTADDYLRDLNFNADDDDDDDDYDDGYELSF